MTNEKDNFLRYSLVVSTDSQSLAFNNNLRKINRNKKSELDQKVENYPVNLQPAFEERFSSWFSRPARNSTINIPTVHKNQRVPVSGRQMTSHVRRRGGFTSTM